jgi:endonuclease YncB( thermonuclease family)
MKRIALFAALALAGCGIVPHSENVTNARIIDGDTFAVGRERFRFARMDAPEIGTCRPGRHCVKGDPLLAKAVLANLFATGGVWCSRQGKDYYGRTLVRCHIGKQDIEDTMVRARVAGWYHKPERKSK